MDAAEQAARARSAGQGGLFGDFGLEPQGGAAPVREWLPAAPWDEHRRLHEEKSALGFYLSGHLFTAHEQELRRFVKTRLADLGRIVETSHGSTQVTVAGIIAAISSSMTRRGRMMRVVMDDRSASEELAVFSEQYEQHRGLLREDALIVVHGKVSKDEYSGGYRFSAERILDLGGARAEHARALRLRMNGQSDAARLASLLEPFRQTIRPVRDARWRSSTTTAPRWCRCAWGTLGGQSRRCPARAVVGVAVARRCRDPVSMKSAATDRLLMRRLLGHVKPHWKVFALGVVGMILTALTEPVFPAIMKILLDHGFGGTGEKRLMWLAPLMIIGLFLLRGVFTFVMNYAMNYVSQEVLFDLRRDMFSRLVEMPIRFFAMNSSGTVIARLVSDVQNVTQTLSSVLIILVRDTFVIIGLLGWLLYLNWQLTTVALILIPLVALAVGSSPAACGACRRADPLHRRADRRGGGGDPQQSVSRSMRAALRTLALLGCERPVARFRAPHDGRVGLIVPITQVMAAVAVSV